MKVLKKEAEFEEAKIGDIVELVTAFTFIRQGSCGKIVGFTDEGKIRVEFPIFEVGHQTHLPVNKDDRFIEARPEYLKFIERPDDNRQLASQKPK